VQVRSQQPLDIVLRGELSADRADVHLGQGVVERIAVPERLVDGRIEAVEDAQLELVRADFRSENEKTTLATLSLRLGVSRSRSE
jgi:hypothetical protein